MIQFIPRDNVVQRAEIKKKTVIEHDKDCAQADVYRQLAKNIEENEMFVIPKPMSMQELEDHMMEYGFMEEYERTTDGKSAAV